MYGQRNHDFLRPCVTLKAQVRHLHEVNKGIPVGYDRSWTAPEDLLVATLAIGFADGFERELSNAKTYGQHGKVYIAGKECPIAGKVCMDMMMVSCGPTGSAINVQPGDYAVCYGKEGPTLKEVAGLLGTAQSDVTCKIDRRVLRKYINLPELGKPVL